MKDQLDLPAPTTPLTAEDVIEALRRRHGCGTGKGEWVCVSEAWEGAADLLAVGAWASAKLPGLPGAGARRGTWAAGSFTGTDLTHPLVAYEVKVSRADYRRELYGYEPKRGWRGSVPPWPHKAARALRRCHFYVFAVPAGLLTADELASREPPAEGRGLYVPPEAGLVEITGAGVRVRVPAPARDAEPLSRDDVAKLLRHGLDPAKLRNARNEAAYLRSRLDQVSQQALERYDRIVELEACLAALEAGTA